ncbi:dihydrofolate reductase family protein [Methanoculleus sp.]|jgi:2,5-diamino-6-(ribosylamino)-4(3H)-pyrimidinone 5'-phosphate reductase|uniref:dihydrofolate reductase family protein n=1 Tax=Methanoculleus sp. TaxID=90427 RepID=UPI00260FF1F3|nr:dihydrofolate reductase family protein [Methanoculleus sp.]
MHPEVIIHNSVSLDHAVRGFDVDLGLHYGALLALGPGAVLAGSATAKSEIEIFMDVREPEAAADRHRPEVRPGDPRPIGVIVDSRGVLKNPLHFYRNMEHTKDVVVLVSETTPEDYLDYLREREYPFTRCGTGRVDLRAAIRELRERFGITRVVSDSGPDLNDVLIREGIAGYDQPDRPPGHRRRRGEEDLRPGRGAGRRPGKRRPFDPLPSLFRDAVARDGRATAAGPLRREFPGIPVALPCSPARAIQMVRNCFIVKEGTTTSQACKYQGLSEPRFTC